MADEALTIQNDSDKTARACAWCGEDISHHHPNARHCSPEHRIAFGQRAKMDRAGYRNTKMFGPHAPANCAYCGGKFEKIDIRQIYCTRGGPCSQKAYRKSDVGQAYFKRPDVRVRIKASARRYASSEHGLAAQKNRDAMPNNVNRRKAYKNSTHGKMVARECQRKAQSQAALAMILAPVHALPKD